MFITQLTTLIKPREEAVKPGTITSHNIIISVTSTNFSFLNFGKFFKFCSDVKKFFEIL